MAKRIPILLDDDDEGGDDSGGRSRKRVRSDTQREGRGRSISLPSMNDHAFASCILGAILSLFNLIMMNNVLLLALRFDSVLSRFDVIGLPYIFILLILIDLIACIAGVSLGIRSIIIAFRQGHSRAIGFTGLILSLLGLLFWIVIVLFFLSRIE